MGLISADTDLVVNGALIPCKYTKKKILNSMRMMRIINEVYDFRRYRSHVFNLNTENCVFSCLIHMLTYTEILLAEEWTELFVFFQQGKVKRIHVTTTKGGYRRQCIQTPSGMVVRGENEIRFVNSDKKRVVYHCTDGIYYENRRLKDRTPLLSGRFIPIRYSHWVNIDFIMGVNGRLVTVREEKEQIVIPRDKNQFVEAEIQKMCSRDLFERIFSPA